MKGSGCASAQLNTSAPREATVPDSKVPAMKKTGPAASAATTIPASSRGPSTSRCGLLGSGAEAIRLFHRLRERLALLLALLDPGGRDDMLVLGDIEQADA